jgi:hypothetical protein
LSVYVHQDLMKGEHKQHGEEDMKVVDKTSCRLEKPTAKYTCD